jgi:hypothetical protein
MTTIASELRELKKGRELLTAEYVVEWARSHTKSALHKAPIFYGWDQKKAAYQHWLHGARMLIAMHVTYATGQRQLVSLSLDRSRPGGGYRDVDDVLRDQSLTEIMLEDALRELHRIQIKYDQVKALKPVWAAVEKVKSRRKKTTTEKRATA